MCPCTLSTNWRCTLCVAIKCTSIYIAPVASTFEQAPVDGRQINELNLKGQTFHSYRCLSTDYKIPMALIRHCHPKWNWLVKWLLQAQSSWQVYLIKQSMALCVCFIYSRRWSSLTYTQHFLFRPPFTQTRLLPKYGANYRSFETVRRLQ